MQRVRGKWTPVAGKYCSVHLFLTLHQCKGLCEALILTSLQISSLVPSSVQRPKSTQGWERRAEQRHYICYTLLLSYSSLPPPCQQINFFSLTAPSKHVAFADPSRSDPCSPCQCLSSCLSITIGLGQLLLWPCCYTDVSAQPFSLEPRAIPASSHSHKGLKAKFL